MDRLIGVDHAVRVGVPKWYIFIVVIIIIIVVIIIVIIIIIIIIVIIIIKFGSTTALMSMF